MIKITDNIQVQLRHGDTFGVKKLTLSDVRDLAKEHDYRCQAWLGLKVHSEIASIALGCEIVSSNEPFFLGVGESTLIITLGLRRYQIGVFPLTEGATIEDIKGRGDIFHELRRLS